MNATNVDLNLLSVLDALLDERNVTRAARRIHLSQPATSNALARLRQLFGDPLLVRSGRGLTLTPRGEALIGPVRAAMEQIDVALGSGEDFDPASSTATFTIATSDALQIGLLPALLARLAAEAPGVRLVCAPLENLRRDVGEPLPERELATGQIDVAIGYFSRPREHHHVRPLFEGDFVCVMRKGHPTAQAGMTLRRFVELGHIVITAANHVHGTVDAALARRKLARRVAVVVPQYSVVPYLLMRSDCIAVLPRRLAEGFERIFGLQLIESPVTLPKFAITQVWHERTHRSLAHRWFRDVVGALGVG
ncbi:MAG: LysR family transcriptional regulator [Pseudomonadota bacterium]